MFVAEGTGSAPIGVRPPPFAMIVLEELCPDIASDLECVAAEVAAIAAGDQIPVAEAARHLAATPGKRLRPGLLLLAARACGYAGPACILPAAVIEVLHGVSLVHDDVIDEADTRRGMASTRAVWGNKMAVLLGDHLLAGAFKRLTESGERLVMMEIADTAREMCRGQIRETMLAGLDLTEAQYLDIVSEKTASLFAASCRLGAAAAEAGERERQTLDSFGRRFGIAYQIADDVSDLTGVPEAMGKPVARDLAQGQITLPIIHALRDGSPASRDELRAILNGQVGAGVDLARIREVIAEAGGFEYATGRIRRFADEAADQLVELAESPARECLLALTRDALAAPITTRN
ncbi:MAG: polyprenyl synthetase family protein [Armatimonadota bacterium]|nr:MAG: polyprenyl synthetase family protein [Armatimonadota bacterium]